jgi:hypothetical protein
MVRRNLSRETIGSALPRQAEAVVRGTRMMQVPAIHQATGTPGSDSIIKSIKQRDRLALSGVQPDFPLLWLGIQFPGTKGLPPLILAHMDLETPSSPAYVSMDYLDATHPNGGTFGLTIEAGTPPMNYLPPRPKCGSRSVTLPSGTITMYCNHGTYFAVGVLDETFITVQGKSRFTNSRVTEPYNSFRAVKAVLQALKPYRP